MSRDRPGMTLRYKQPLEHNIFSSTNNWRLLFSKSAGCVIRERLPRYHGYHITNTVHHAAIGTTLYRVYIIVINDGIHHFVLSRQQACRYICGSSGLAAAVLNSWPICPRTFVNSARRDTLFLRFAILFRWPSTNCETIYRLERRVIDISFPWLCTAMTVYVRHVMPNTYSFCPT